MSLESIVAFLDIGSFKTGVMIADVGEKGLPRVLSLVTRPSVGLQEGHIIHMAAASQMIAETLDQAEKKAGVRVSRVVLVLSSVYLQSTHHEISQPIHGGVVKDSERLAQYLKSRFKTPANHMLLHFIPLHYKIDDQPLVLDPVELHGQQISSVGHFITACQHKLQNLVEAVQQCHMEVAGVVAAPYATALSVLSHLTESNSHDCDEKNIWVLDMGHQTTSLGLFWQGRFAHVGHVPLGSDHITRDLAKVLGIGCSEAEKLKIRHGHALLTSKDRYVSIPHLYEEDAIYPFKRFMFVQIIQSRLEEIFDLIAKEHEPSGTLVLQGGGSLLKGVDQLAVKIFNCPLHATGLPPLPGLDAYQDLPGTSALLGGALYWQQRHKSLKTITSYSHYAQSCWAWLKENF
jgi:cell division protein FtsA